MGEGSYWRMERGSINRRVVIVGAGNVATHIAKALCDKVNIIQIYSHNIENADTLARDVMCSNSVNDISMICNDADVYIISIKDDAIESFIENVNCENNQSLWVHTSGSKPITVFEGKMQNYGVLYPLQTFSKTVDIEMSEVPIFVEGNSESTLIGITNFAKLFSQKIYQSDSDKRRQLHVAAVFACNFANHMWALGADLLKDADLPFEILMPLIKESVAKLSKVSPQQGQTGPAARGDRAIIEKHLSMLNGDKKELYKTISESIIKTAYECDKL